MIKYINNMNINLCLGLITLLVLVVVSLYLKKNSIVEGYKNMNKQGIPTLIQDNSTKLADSLLINKYRTTYEDTLINLHNQIGLAILNEIVDKIDTISKNPTSKKSQEYISQINELEKFKSTINETMEILDKN